MSTLSLNFIIFETNFIEAFFEKRFLVALGLDWNQLGRMNRSEYSEDICWHSSVALVANQVVNNNLATIARA